MSLMPLLLRDWWDDSGRPMVPQLLDQHFGLGLDRDDLFSSFNRPRTYLRPWRHLKRQESGISSLTADKDTFQVILDVQQFAPSEITVKTVGNCVVVEAKHEEKRDEHGFVSRHFVRRYLLPQDIEAKDVISSLSSDGVLTITAPKKTKEITEGERIVPIIQTGIPAVKPAAAEEQPKIEQPLTPETKT